MSPRIAAVLISLVLTVCLASNVFAARLSGATEAGQTDGIDLNTKVNIDFRDVDVRVVAKFISELTGKNFVFDKDVREKVTVYSPTPVTVKEAFRLFETVLKIHGYTTIPSDGVIKIVPSQKARSMDVEMRPAPPSRDGHPDDRVVTQLVRLKHADAQELQTVLQPLMGQTGILMAYDSGNTLIVTDYASNIDRLLRIIEAVDVTEEGTQLTVIPLTHASAKKVADELKEVLQARRTGAAAQQGRQGKVDFVVTSDDRSNNLIVMARASETRMIRDLVAKLDIETPRGSDLVHVVFLKNALAEDLAKTLNELTGQVSQANGQQNPNGRAPSPLLLQSQVIITSEKATNSLIIRAERPDFLVLKDIIEKLDIQRAQVLVEGVIMEMSINKATALGAEWRVLDKNIQGSSETLPFGGTNFQQGTSQGMINQMAANPFAGPAGLVLGAAEGTLTWNGTTFINIAALVRALEQDNEVNILSTPHLLTMDNEEARIIVGEERPFLKSSMATAVGSATPAITNTYDFKDLGLTLKLTPQITQGEYIKLKIYQELKDFISEAETGAVTSTKRETETTVLVKNKETVVIGGLIMDTQREAKNQVPCLGDVPVLGWAFKVRDQSGSKLNLLVLIKPTIIRTAQHLEDLTEKKRRETEAASEPQPSGDQYPLKGPRMIEDREKYQPPVQLPSP